LGDETPGLDERPGAAKGKGEAREMKFKLTTHFPASASLIEAGEIIDLADRKWAWLPMPMPMAGVMAMDQEAYDHLAVAHGVDNLRWLQFAKGITPVTPEQYPLWLTTQNERKSK
jgi:hypothetical protein